jgi:hypothetical protein
VDVFCTASFDAAAHEYVYEYSLLNDSHSEGVVDFFGLRQVGTLDSVEAARGWMSTTGQCQGAPRSAVWAAVGYGDELADDLDFMRFPPPIAIFAGELATGFTLRSREPPETTGFVALPFVSIVVESEDQAPGPFTSIPTVWETGFVGTVDAPRVASEPRRPAPRLSVSRDTTAVRASFILARSAHVRIDVIDASGTMVAEVLDRSMGPGQGRAIWNGTDERGRALPPGSYFTRMVVNGVNLGRHHVVVAR